MNNDTPPPPARAREWWILSYPFIKTSGGNGSYECYDYRLTSRDAVHVIEKRAYTALMEQAVALRGALDEIAMIDDTTLGFELLANEAIKAFDQFIQQRGVEK